MEICPCWKHFFLRVYLNSFFKFSQKKGPSDFDEHRAIKKKLPMINSEKIN